MQLKTKKRRKTNPLPAPEARRSAFLLGQRRTSAELHQAIRDSILQHPDWPVCWHAKQLNALEAAILLVRSGLRRRGDIGVDTCRN